MPTNGIEYLEERLLDKIEVSGNFKICENIV
jgi:hypothetical protein